MPKNMPGLALSDVRGPLDDLLGKLDSVDKEEWLEAFKLFLRHQPVWTRPYPMRMETVGWRYSVPVGTRKTSQCFKGCRFMGPNSLRLDIDSTFGSETIWGPCNGGEPVLVWQPREGYTFRQLLQMFLETKEDDLAKLSHLLIRGGHTFELNEVDGMCVDGEKHIDVSGTRHVFFVRDQSYNLKEAVVTPIFVGVRTNLGRISPMWWCADGRQRLESDSRWDYKYRFFFKL